MAHKKELQFSCVSQQRFCLESGRPVLSRWFSHHARGRCTHSLLSGKRRQDPVGLPTASASDPNHTVRSLHPHVFLTQCPVAAVACSSLTTDIWDGCIVLVNTKTGTCIQRVSTLAGNTSAAWGGAHAQLLLVAGDMPPIQLYTVDNTGALKATSTVFKGHHDIVTALHTTTHGQYLASVSYDRTMRVWALESRACKVSFSHAAPVLAVSWQCGSAEVVVTGSQDGACTIWDCRQALPARTWRSVFPPHQNEAITTVAWSYNAPSSFAVGTETGRLAVLDWRAPATAVCEKEVLASEEEAAVFSAMFSPDRRDLLAVGTDNGEVKVFSVEKNAFHVRHSHSLHEDCVRGVAWVPSAGLTLASVAWDATCALVRLDTTAEVLEDTQEVD